MTDNLYGMSGNKSLNLKALSAAMAASAVRDANNGGVIMNAVQELTRRSNSAGAAMRDLNLDLDFAEEIEPDDFDLELIAEAERENDGSVISLEQLAEELGIAL